MSRLQKSVLLMSFSIILGFTCVLTLSRTHSQNPPLVVHSASFQQQNQPLADNLRSSIDENRGVGPGPGPPEVVDVFPDHRPESQSTSASRKNKYSWNLPKASSSLTTVPEVLKPDYSDLSTDKGYNDKPVSKLTNRWLK